MAAACRMCFRRYPRRSRHMKRLEHGCVAPPLRWRASARSISSTPTKGPGKWKHCWAGSPRASPPDECLAIAPPALCGPWRLEVRVHLDLPFDLLPTDYVLMEIDLGNLPVETLATIPADPAAFGEAWLFRKAHPFPSGPVADRPRICQPASQSRPSPGRRRGNGRDPRLRVRPPPVASVNRRPVRLFVCVGVGLPPWNRPGIDLLRTQPNNRRRGLS